MEEAKGSLAGEERELDKESGDQAHMRVLRLIFGHFLKCMTG